MEKRAVVAALACAVVGSAGESTAQRVAASLDELVRMETVGVDDAVYVTTKEGVRWKGEVVRASGSGLEISDGLETWTLAGEDVSRVEMQDGLRNGTLVGIGVGVGFALAACATWPNEGCIYSNVLYGYPAVLVGGFVGAIVDASIHRVVLDSGSEAAAVLTPEVRNDGVGVRLLVTW